MTIAVDFDGVIHAYSRGWADGTIYDPPVPGALDGLRALMDRDAVFVFTSRSTEQVADWLFERGEFNITWEPPGESICEFWNDRERLLVTNRKLPATHYLDDRAVRFTDWAQALADLAPSGGSSSAAAEAEATARVFAGLHRSAEQDVSRVIALYEQWVKAGPPPLGTSLSRWWDARLVELHDAILPPHDQTKEQ